jgi:hypothetical protein
LVVASGQMVYSRRVRWRVELVLEPPPLDRRRQIPVHASSCELIFDTHLILL